MYRVFNVRRARINLDRYHLAISKKTFVGLHSFYQELSSHLSILRKKDNISVGTFRDKATLLCNRIEEIFTTVLNTRERVSVCIKFIKTDSILNNDILNAEIFTFARSPSTSPERLKYDNSGTPPDKIKENSDFEMIVSNESQFKGVDYFACENLDDYSEIYKEKYNKPFMNSHLNPPYKSAIVVPIRSKIEYVSEKLKRETNNRNSYHIVGFLCIDSEEQFGVSEDHRLTRFKNAVELACLIGDTLYPFLEEYLNNAL